MRLIDADKLVTIQVYDDMTEEYGTKKVTIADAIDEWSDEGCPETIDAELVIRCKDCRWFDKKTEHSSYGYCHAMKHAYLSKNWEISIYRTQKEDFYCADGEKKNEAD